MKPRHWGMITALALVVVTATAVTIMVSRDGAGIGRRRSPNGAGR
jgi:hypothetical protein